MLTLFPSITGPSQLKQQQLPNHAPLQSISQQPYPSPHLSSNQPFSTFGVQNASQRVVPPPQPRATSSATVNPVLLNPKPASRSPSLAPPPSSEQSQAMPSVTGQKRSASSSRASSPSQNAGSDAKKQKTNSSVIDMSMPSPPPAPAVQSATSQPMGSSLSEVLYLSPVNATGTLDGYVTRDAPSTPSKAKEEAKELTVKEEKKEKVKEATPPRAPPAPSSSKPAAGPFKPKPSTTPASPITMNTIRALITPAAFKTTMPIALFKNFWAPEDGKAPLKLSRDELMEVLVQIRDHAPEPWLKKMGTSPKSLEVWSDWLIEMRSNPVEWQWVMMPAFEILAKTEISQDHTTFYKIALRLRKLAAVSEEKKLVGAGALKEVYTRYQAFATSFWNKQAASSKEENVPAKRKIDTVGKEGGKENGESSSKRPATSSSTAARTASKPGAKTSSSTATPGAPAAKPAAKPAASKAAPSKTSTTKSDMSFFSTPPTSSTTAKPKPKPPAAKPAPPPVSATSSLLRSTLDNLHSQNAAAKADAEKIRLQPKVVRYTKSGRVIGTVKFRDAQLEEVKYFTAEPYEAHIEGGAGPSVHAMDMDEGRALANARNHDHEAMDWYEPSPYFDPYPSGPPETPESIFQSERERGVLAAQVFPGAPIPNPSEEGVRIVSPHDGNTRNMVPHHPFPPPQPHALAYPAAIPPVNIEDILKNLGDIPGLGQPAHQERQPQYRSGQYQPPAGHGYPDQGSGGYYSNHSGPSAPQQEWNGYQNPGGWQGQGIGYDYDSGRGNQGKGKNNKKGDYHGTRKCKFFASGHCLKGNDCGFAHY
ncbi:hypothetical protein IAT38_002545 [Cryptococcus sp. DSM 104549]